MYLLFLASLTPLYFVIIPKLRLINVDSNKANDVNANYQLCLKAVML